MVLDFASLSRRRLMEFAIAMPIAVPSCSLSIISISSVNSNNTSISRVRGHCIYDSPAKTISPKRSPSRSLINFLATAFAASKRLGLKSCASIEDD